MGECTEWSVVYACYQLWVRIYRLGPAFSVGAASGDLASYVSQWFSNFFRLWTVGNADFCPRTPVFVMQS